MPLRHHFIHKIGLFIGYGYLIPFVHTAPLAIDFGVSQVQASLLLSILGASSFIGRISLGFIADRIKNRLLILRICFGVMAVVGFAWPFLNQFYCMFYFFCDDFFLFLVLVIFCFIFGFFGGGYISMIPAVVAEYFGIGKLPSLIGIMYFSSAIGNTIGPPVTGILFDRTNSYIVGGLIGAGTLVIGFGKYFFFFSSLKSVNFIFTKITRRS